MKTYTIADALEMAGQVVPRLEAKLIKVYDRKTGEGEYGPYSFQNGEIQDSTGSMKIVFSSLPDASERLGDTLVFKSMPTAKHGLKGVEVKANEYKGKTTMELKVSKAAMIIGNGEESNDEQDIPADFKPMPKKKEMKQPEDFKTGIALARNRMSQLSELYALSFKTAQGIEILGGLDGTTMKDVASCLFIQAVREGLADKMPIRSEKPNPEELEDEPSDKEMDPF